MTEHCKDCGKEVNKAWSGKALTNYTDQMIKSLNTLYREAYDVQSKTNSISHPSYADVSNGMIALNKSIEELKRAKKMFSQVKI